MPPAQFRILPIPLYADSTRLNLWNRATKFSGFFMSADPGMMRLSGIRKYQTPALTIPSIWKTGIVPVKRATQMAYGAFRFRHFPTNKFAARPVVRINFSCPSEPIFAF